MRRIKEGDVVQAFLDASIKGVVRKLEHQKSTTIFVGGTAESEIYCVLELEDGRFVRYKASELYHAQ
tara:strand:+ start:374 stop:574 length:201 start_codon:yes stop_codon:yes gene_type:complete